MIFAALRVIGLVCLIGFSAFVHAAPTYTVLDVSPSGTYKSIQQAIDASQKESHVLIRIYPGIYRETLYVTRNNIALIGAGAGKTILEHAVLRANWRKTHETDWGAAVINVNASNLIIAGMTVRNVAGRELGTDDHQFTIRGFALTDKVILADCEMHSDGADTVSLWNKSGRYFHTRCHFSGYTDMVCPRGAALITDSTFFNRKRSATLWHDGEVASEHKLVVVNSKFDGVPGFQLGRHHYDAQFYLLNSSFSSNMANTAIYRKRYLDSSRNRPNLYGERYFFQGNQYPTGYEWVGDNFDISDAAGSGGFNDIEAWVFGPDWSPSSELKILYDMLSRQPDADMFVPLSSKK